MNTFIVFLKNAHIYLHWSFPHSPYFLVRNMFLNIQHTAFQAGLIQDDTG